MPKEVLQSIDVTASSQPVDVEQTQSERQLTGIQILDVPYPSTHSLREAIRLIPGRVEDSTGGGLHFDGGREKTRPTTFWTALAASDPLTGRLNARVSVEAVEHPRLPERSLFAGIRARLGRHTADQDGNERRSASLFGDQLPTGCDHPARSAVGQLDPALQFLRADPERACLVLGQSGRRLQHQHRPGCAEGNQNTTSSLQLGNLLHTQFNLTPSNPSLLRLPDQLPVIKRVPG